MAYKSITSFVESEAELEQTLPAALKMTQMNDGHLSICTLGVDMTPSGGFYMGASPILLQETLQRAENDARKLEELCREKLEGSQIRWQTDSAVIQFGGLPGMVGLRSRFSDLIVQSRPYGENTHPTQEAVIEAALFEGNAAVMMVPQEQVTPEFGQRIMIAWNQSNEALNAVRRALPLLRQAEQVSVVVVDPPVHSPERSDPGGLLTQMLSRHGVRAEVSVLAKTMPRVSDVLMRHMVDLDASIIVMGAYGHSRLREAILGGATRNMLENAERAVFLAH